MAMYSVGRQRRMFKGLGDVALLQQVRSSGMVGHSGAQAAIGAGTMAPVRVSDFTTVTTIPGVDDLDNPTCGGRTGVACPTATAVPASEGTFLQRYRTPIIIGAVLAASALVLRVL